MKHKVIRPFASLCAAFLASCGGLESIGNVSLWPFGEGKEQERSRTPPGATAYQCQGGKQFYVRDLENGNAAWLTLPDRDMRLERDRSAPGNRYARANTTLEIEANGASLSDGPDLFKGCTRS